MFGRLDEVEVARRVKDNGFDDMIPMFSMRWTMICYDTALFGAGSVVVGT